MQCISSLFLLQTFDIQIAKSRWRLLLHFLLYLLYSCYWWRYKPLLYKWNFMVNSKKKMEKKMKKMPIQLYLAGKQKMKLHMYLHEWSTLTSSMRCHFCPWTASIFFFVIQIIFIHKSMHTIRIQYLNQKIHWTLILNQIWPTQRLHCVRLSLAKMLLVKMATAGSIESVIDSIWHYVWKKSASLKL